MRKKIPSDTGCFRFHDANPKGKKTGDCVLRALSVVFDRSWDDMLDDLVSYAHKYKQMANDPILYSKYVKDNGYVQVKQPVHADGTKVSGRDLCNAFSSMNDGVTHPVLLRLGTHHVSVISYVKDEKGIYHYKVLDTWNCSEDKVGKMYMHADDAEKWNHRATQWVF